MPPNVKEQLLDRINLVTHYILISPRNPKHYEALQQIVEESWGHLERKQRITKLRPPCSCKAGLFADRYVLSRIRSWGVFLTYSIEDLPPRGTRYEAHFVKLPLMKRIFGYGKVTEVNERGERVLQSRCEVP